MNKNYVLHITPHLGGGVGRVLLNYLSKIKNTSSFNHLVTCLDYANSSAVKKARDINLLLFDKMVNKKKELLELIAKTDLVLVHWWNHPLLYDFLVRTQLPACRLIIWSHIAGFYPPGVFTKKILEYPDIFVFSTPASFKIKEVKDLSNEQKKSFRVVWSTGGTDHVKLIKPKKHKGFNIGYIGTVDYAKIHPDFLKICSQVDIPKVRFIVCGGPSEKEIKNQAKKLGIAERLHFTGKVSNIAKYLSIFDIFGYPLNLCHYGTCDQVLQESMAVGVVPVVLANPMESYMVKDGVTGIVVKNKKEYIKALQELYYNPKLRNLLSKNAKKYAIETFSLEKMIDEWGKIFDEVLDFPKTAKRWKINEKIKNISAKDIFLESLGDYGKNFISYCNAKNKKEKKKAIEKIKKMAQFANWQSKTKSTVHQYNSFFPRDKCLSFWSKMMRSGEFNEGSKRCREIH